MRWIATERWQKLRSKSKTGVCVFLIVGISTILCCSLPAYVCAGVPAPVGGTTFNLSILYAAFDMPKGTWRDIICRFDPTKEEGLLGAPNVIEWAENPDAVVELDGKRYPQFAHLNLSKPYKLQGIIRDDRRSRYFRDRG